MPIDYCQSCLHIANRRYGRKYRGKHQLTLALNVVTTATGLILIAPLLLRRSGSSRSFFPRMDFSDPEMGKKHGFGVKMMFCKLWFMVSQLLKPSLFFIKNKYSKGLQRVTTHNQIPKVVTNMLQNCNTLLQVVTNRL